MTTGLVSEQLTQGSELKESKDKETATKSSGSDSREYIVFVEKAANTFEILGTFDAQNAESAIKTVDPDANKRYAAVPARNWSVGRPKVRTITQVSVEFE